MPFAFGNDTYWTTQLMTQDLDKLNDVVLAGTGKASFTSKKYANFETGWKQMVDAKCFNDDVRRSSRHRASRPSTGARPR